MGVKKLILKNISKKVGAKKILDNLSAEVSSLKPAIFLGGSGVGKSTLLRVLNNLETLDNGEVILDGIKLDLNNVSKNHTIGLVFQHFNLFEHLTVLENVTLALINILGYSKTKADKIAEDVLNDLGLLDYKDCYVSSLSGGQKQRLALARLIALKPKVICLDEPTSALDPYLTNFVADTITGLSKKGYIVLIATHDTSLIERLDADLFLMSEGQIIEHISSKELTEKKSPLIFKFLNG